MTMIKSENRARIARENAGLSIGQAAKLLGITTEQLQTIEDAETPQQVGRLAELYRVRAEWITGEVERYDYTRIDSMLGADKLTPHDRDVIAEFAASLPVGGPHLASGAAALEYGRRKCNARELSEARAALATLRKAIHEAYHEHGVVTLEHLRHIALAYAEIERALDKMAAHPEYKP